MKVLLLVFLCALMILSILGARTPKARRLRRALSENDEDDGNDDYLFNYGDDDAPFLDDDNLGDDDNFGDDDMGAFEPFTDDILTGAGHRRRR